MSKFITDGLKKGEMKREVNEGIAGSVFDIILSVKNSTPLGWFVCNVCSNIINDETKKQKILTKHIKVGCGNSKEPIAMAAFLKDIMQIGKDHGALSTEELLSIAPLELDSESRSDAIRIITNEAVKKQQQKTTRLVSEWMDNLAINK